MDHYKYDWYEEMTRKLQINGKSLRTQQAYTRAVRQLVDHYHKAPEEICEQELQDYFLFRRNTSKWAPKTLRICYSGIKFYYQILLQHDWNLFAILRTQNERRLPCVLSRPEILRIFDSCQDLPQLCLSFNRLRLRTSSSGSALYAGNRY